ncbi:MAG: DUF1573 domain-containing protein [Bacteroidetes bacterium]|nr:DUF1573 domain-containing protein [Bacteroidota bacterium]
MKKISITLLSSLFLLTVACGQENSKNESTKSAKIKFTETVHDYGEIELNSHGTFEFKFTNEGKETLILSNVRSSCGCTVPAWPKTPIKKGEQAVIKVKYNTARPGSFNKSISVYSNGSAQPVILRIKGTVINKNG